MRAQNEPADCAVPVTVVFSRALSLAMMIAQAEPFQVPRLSPNVTVESGSSAVTVALTFPALVTVNGWVRAPLTVSVSEFVSVTATGVDVSGLVGVLLLPQAAVPSMRRAQPTTV